jgi:hypothetical protein
MNFISIITVLTWPELSDHQSVWREQAADERFGAHAI